MSQQARDHIIETAAKLFHRQGYHATGIQRILQEARVPKGSFYFYFKSKQELALAVIDYFDQRWGSFAAGILDEAGRPPLERLARFFAWFRQYFTQNGFAGGCPVGNLAQEMGDLNPVLAAKVNASITAMAGRVEKVLAQARQAGQLAPGVDTRELAYFIISSWQGALIRMKASKSAEPMLIFEKMIFGGLLA